MTNAGEAVSSRRSFRPSEPLRRPLVAACILFVVATRVGLWVPLSPAPVVGLILALAALGRFAVSTRGARTILFAAVFALMAALAASHRAFFVPSSDLSQKMERSAERFSVRGRIRGEVGMEVGGEGERLHFMLTLLEIRRRGEWEPASGRLRVRWQQPPNTLRPVYGDVWEMEGVVREPPGGVRHSADARPFSMRVDGGPARRLAEGQGNPLRAWSLARRRDCARILGAGLDDFPETAGLLRALLLGYREELPEAHERAFSRTGMLHIFAVSGLHVGVMAALAIGLLQGLGLPRYRWILVLAPLLIFYTVLTGMKPSAVRACAMALAYWSASLLWRRPDPPSALALACMALLLWDPLQLLAPGFLLSFVVVTGLVVLGGPLHGWMSARLRGDALQLPLRSSWSETVDAVRRYGVGLASTSVVAWLCSSPLIASVFHLFSPVAILGNLLVVPMAFVMVLTGCLSLITGGLSPWLAEVFNHANRLFFSLVLVWIEWMDRVPHGHSWVPAPSIWAVSLWFLGLVLLRVTRRGVVRLSAWALVTVLLLSRFGTWGGAAREAHLLNIEGELAVVWLEASGEAVLVTDLGLGSAWNARDVARHLQQLGVDRLNVVLALRGGTVDRLMPVLSESFRVAEWWSPAWEDLAAAEQAGVRPRRLMGGERGFLPGGTQWEVLVPTDARRPEGRGGLVVRLGYADTSLLVVGTGGFDVKDAMLASERMAGADVAVLVPDALQGLMTPRWLDWAEPEKVVVCVGPVRWIRDDHAAVERLLDARGVEARFLAPGESLLMR